VRPEQARNAGPDSATNVVNANHRTVELRDAVEGEKHAAYESLADGAVRRCGSEARKNRRTLTAAEREEAECGKQDLNLHGVATTRPSTWRVCQFRHSRGWDDLSLWSLRVFPLTSSRSAAGIDTGLLSRHSRLIWSVIELHAAATQFIGQGRWVGVLNGVDAASPRRGHVAGHVVHV